MTSGPSVRLGADGRLLPGDGLQSVRRQAVQIRLPHLELGGGGEGGPRDAEENVHPPGQSCHRRTVDAKGGDIDNFKFYILENSGFRL